MRVKKLSTKECVQGVDRPPRFAASRVRDIALLIATRHEVPAVDDVGFCAEFNRWGVFHDGVVRALRKRLGVFDV